MTLRRLHTAASTSRLVTHDCPPISCSRPYEDLSLHNQWSWPLPEFLRSTTRRGSIPHDRKVTAEALDMDIATAGSSEPKLAILQCTQLRLAGSARRIWSILLAGRWVKVLG